MKVQLIFAPDHIEKIVACAAKLCYSPASINTLLDGLDPAKTTQFIEMLTQLGHESPIEHANFTFAIEGVSRSLLAQITRHRIASFSVQSQRYVAESEFSFVVPPEIEASEQAKKLFLQAMQEDISYYNRIADILKIKHKERLLQEGCDAQAAERQAEKLAIEDARFVLPNACSTKMMVTMNARSLMNFFKLRCCNRAQWEIRELAWKMLGLVYAHAPSLFANAGPSCVHGSCSEGKMSCGRVQQVRAYAEELRKRAGENE